MRESVIANRHWWGLVLAAAFYTQVGCGADDSEQSASAMREPRKQEVDASVTVQLPDETAGKSCEVDADCEPGMCLTIFVASSGGMMEAPGGYCSLGCMSNAECGASATCSGAFAGFGGIGATPGRCLKSCAMDADCREGYRCVTALGMPVTSGAQDPTGGLLGGNACEPIPETQKLADGLVGNPCEKHSDCGEGRCQRASGMLAYPGGYCSGACLEDADCGAQGICTPPATGGAGSCSLRCEADSDCREGYRCRSVSNQLQCAPGAKPLPDDVVGQACESDNDCGGNAMSCASLLGNVATVAGYCSQPCVDASDCGAGGACIGALPAELPPELAGLLGMSASCYRTCSTAADCRNGYRCALPMSLLGTTGTQTVCVVGEATGDADAGVEGP
jgi:hypothetical protein